MTYLASALGLTVGNFLWQAFASQPLWDVACERSFFQCVAVLVLFFLEQQ